MASSFAMPEPQTPAGPKVTLVNAFAEPLNNAMATARTCYASRVIWPGEMDRDEKSRNLRDRIAKSTYEAGHHTTLQHASFQFVLEDVSRQFIWSFLHAHPFYNSEQVSQRYVAVKKERVFVPPFARAEHHAQYQAAIGACTEAYHKLCALLFEPASRAYFALFPARQKQTERYRNDIKKRAQEVARYVLPVSTFAHLYHTVSGLTLHRYHRLSRQLDVPHETKLVVDAMVQAVKAHDPLFFRDIEDPIALEDTHEARVLQSLGRIETGSAPQAFIAEFDAKLDGKLARLIDYSASGESTMAQSVRTMLGRSAGTLSDDDAIAMVLDPERNPNLKNALNLTAQSKLSRAMAHPHYTFAKKLSHAADSQEQRHRMVPGARPILQTHYAGIRPDVVVPGLITHSDEALALFDETMALVWRTIDNLLADGVAPEQALYLLPNAFPIRFLASGDLLSQHHKWVSRLCYNAQEEIWQAALDEAEAVAHVHPRIGRWLLPPCGLRVRSKARPICPEGPRFCGVPVWKLKRSEYRRVL